MPPKIKELEAAKVTEDVIDVEVELELQQVTMPDGMPLFIGDVDDVIERVREMGYSWFYVLSCLKSKYEVKGQNNSTKTEWLEEPKVFKVLANAIGFAINTVEDDSLNLTEIEPIAYFKLPKIPYELIQKLDYFFREVDKKHNTEAIVMMTFDPQIGGSKGWGLLIPEQTNTAGHCKYDPQSVVDELVDQNENREDFSQHIFIAGTAHSHPGMSAFASHTDHGDQMGNDGIHITFGWLKNQNATEHYIELQMGGGSFVLPEDKAFADAPEPPQFPEIEDWIGDKVKKASFGNPIKGHGATTYGTGSSTGTSKDWYEKNFPKATDPNAFYDLSQKPYKLQEGCPHPNKFTVVIRLLDDDEKRCPACKNFFRPDAIKRRRCWDCLAFLMLPNEEVDDIIRIRREALSDDTPVADLMAEYAPKTIMIWEREYDMNADPQLKDYQEIYFEVEESSGKV